MGLLIETVQSNQPGFLIFLFLMNHFHHLQFPILISLSAVKTKVTNEPVSFDICHGVTKSLTGLSY